MLQSAVENVASSSLVRLAKRKSSEMLLVGKRTFDIQRNPVIFYTAVFIGCSLFTFFVTMALNESGPSGHRKGSLDNGLKAFMRYENLLQNLGRRGILLARQTGGRNAPARPEGAAPVFCVYNRDSEKRREPEHAKYVATRHLPLRYCTHMTYAFVSPQDIVDGENEDGVTPTGLIRTVTRRLREFNTLREHNPKLEITVAVGGPKVQSRSFSDEAATDGRREHFAQRAEKYLDKHRISGLSVFWMYPTEGNGRPADRENYPKLLHRIKQSFHKKGYLLTVFIPHDTKLIDKAFSMKEISKEANFLLLGTYGYKDPEQKSTWIQSPLYSDDALRGKHDPSTIDGLVSFLRDRGTSPKKMVLGISTRGVTYTLDKPHSDTAGARLAVMPKTLGGSPGPFTAESGMLSYFEVCYNIFRDGWARVYDGPSGCPYAFKGTEFVSYDDPESIIAKVVYLRNHTMGGAMLWDVSNDDFMGLCGPQNALAKAVYDGIRSYAPFHSNSKSRLG